MAKDRLQLTQTQEQKARAATLLLASDSPAAFVRSCLVKKKDGELGVVDLYAHYQQWCRENHIRPFPSRPFTSTAKEDRNWAGDETEARFGGRKWKGKEGLAWIRALWTD